MFREINKQNGRVHVQLCNTDTSHLFLIRFFPFVFLLSLIEDKRAWFSRLFRTLVFVYQKHRLTANVPVFTREHVWPWWTMSRYQSQCVSSQSYVFGSSRVLCHLYQFLRPPAPSLPHRIHSSANLSPHPTQWIQFFSQGGRENKTDLGLFYFIYFRPNYSLDGFYFLFSCGCTFVCSKAACLFLFFCFFFYSRLFFTRFLRFTWFTYAFVERALCVICAYMWVGELR